MNLNWKQLTNEWTFRAAIFGVFVFGFGFVSGTFFGSEVTVFAFTGWFGVILIMSLLSLGIGCTIGWLWEQSTNMKYGFKFTRQAIMEKLERDKGEDTEEEEETK